MAKTDAPQASRQGGSSWLPVLVAVLAMGAFIGWLMIQRPAETVAVAEPGSAAPAPVDDGAVTVVTAEELNSTARMRELRGQDIRIDDIEVVSTMGSQLFWVQPPDGGPLLAKLGDALVAAGTQAPQPGRYVVVGRVLEKTATQLAEWEQAGVLRSAGDRTQAEFGSSYIEVRRVAPAQS